MIKCSFTTNNGRRCVLESHETGKHQLEPMMKRLDAGKLIKAYAKKTSEALDQEFLDMTYVLTAAIDHFSWVSPAELEKHYGTRLRESMDALADRGFEYGK